MATAAISLDVQQLIEWVEALRARNTAANLAPTFNLIAESFVAAVSENFDTAGHGRWPPLAPSTKKKKGRGGDSAQILKHTGLLASSIQPFFGGDFAEAATDRDYAVYHVSDAPRSHIPLRNFFDIPEEIFDEAVAELIDAILAE